MKGKVPLGLKYIAMQIKSEYKIHMAGIILLILVNVANNVPSHPVPFFKLVLIGLVVSAIIAIQWLGVVFILKIAWKKYPDAYQVWKRMISSSILGIGWVAFWMYPSDRITTGWLHEMDWQYSFIKIMGYIFNALIFCITVLGITEAIYYFSKLRQTDLEKEELRRMKLHSQYDSLKQQVNPHFLFNSLNTLSALIRIDPIQAEKFVEEMSHVYRYILHNTNDLVVSLEKEIHFTYSYLNLLKTRFGNALTVKVEVDTGIHFLIPPLTLQLLIENAVKHNIVTAENPLRLDIFTTPDQRLIVKNNLQKKNSPVPSEKIGLTNIMSKYKYLNAPDVIVEETETEFIVDLPLLKFVP
jgi:hypothetical protein